MYTPTCEVCNEENERVTVVVLSSMTDSVTVIPSPIMTRPLVVIHRAEGMLVRPSMTSFTVHVRVRSSLPATTGTVLDVSIITSRELSGTREMAGAQPGFLKGVSTS